MTNKSQPKPSSQLPNRELSPETPADATGSKRLDQANDHLSQLVQHTQALVRTVQEQQQNQVRRQRSPKIFLRKMATEIPPVVLAVLLAFGINSWWQQRSAQQLAAQSRANIITESRANLATYELIVQRDRRNLRRLERQIERVKAGIIHLDTLYSAGYGQGINLFNLSEGAWQAATLTGGIAHFEPELVKDASDVYSRVHSRNIKHAGFNLAGYERYQKETLLAFLLENRTVLADHASNCAYEASIVRDFLEKYDPTFSSE